MLSAMIEASQLSASVFSLLIVHQPIWIYTCLSSDNSTTVQNFLSNCKTGIYVPKLLIPNIHLQMPQILGDCREIARIQQI